MKRIYFEAPGERPVYIRSRDKRRGPKLPALEIAAMVRKWKEQREEGIDPGIHTARYHYDLYLTARDDGHGRDTMRAGHPLWTFNQWRLTEGRKFK